MQPARSPRQVAFPTSSSLLARLRERGNPIIGSARQTDVRGWIVATFSGGALLGSNIVTDHRLRKHSFDEPGSGSTPITTSGKAPSGTFLRAPALQCGWVVGRESCRLCTIQRDGSALGVGLLGAGVTLLLFLLLGLLTRSRPWPFGWWTRYKPTPHQALYDSLTDLPNRALILDRAEQMIVRATRQPFWSALSSLTLTTSSGQRHLRPRGGRRAPQGSRFRLSEELRASDSVGRLGGDDSLFWQKRTRSIGPELVAEKLLASFAEPFILERSRVAHCTSASASEWPGSSRRCRSALRDADVALYEAKPR